MVEKIDIDNDDEESAEANKPISLDFQVMDAGLKCFFPILQVFKRALLFSMLGNACNVWGTLKIGSFGPP